ncbi:hypothetical protein GCM10011488_06970 [Steroidobacter agaridevorans]|nr:hypothetical protein GCM10011488_06970 [Steroidobacter agaridevorans]
MTAPTVASKARAAVRNTGSNPVTAARVAGSEPLKITTPIKPNINPWSRFFMAASWPTRWTMAKDSPVRYK